MVCLDLFWLAIVLSNLIPQTMFPWKWKIWPDVVDMNENIANHPHLSCACS